jgi:hypothetical protein
MASIDMSAAPAEQAGAVADTDQAARSEWIETVLTVLFTASAILFVSFLAVVTGLV